MYGLGSHRFRYRDCLWFVVNRLQYQQASSTYYEREVIQMEDVLQLVFVVFGGAYAIMKVVWFLYGQYNINKLYRAIYRAQKEL